MTNEAKSYGDANVVPFRGARIGEKETLKSGGGDGTFNGMEARVARLEEDLREIKSDLKALRVDTAEIKGKVSQMPTIWQTISLVIAILGGAFAIVKFGLN